MTVKFIANLISNDVKPVNVTDETSTSYKTTDGTGLRRKSTSVTVLFNTEIDAKRFIAMHLNRQKNEARNAYTNAQSRLLETLLRFNLEQCGYCNEFHEVGAGHDCTQHPF